MILHVRLAIAADRDWLREAYLDLLRYLDSQGYLILPTEANADWMIDDVFLPAIEERLGVFVGCDENSHPVAALFWIVDRQPVEARFPTATSYGQWVSPEYRGQGLIAKMVGPAVDWLKRVGVRQVHDMVHTPEAAEAAKSCGFEIQTKIVTLKL